MQVESLIGVAEPRHAVVEARHGATPWIGIINCSAPYADALICALWRRSLVVDDDRVLSPCGDVYVLWKHDEVGEKRAAPVHLRLPQHG